MSAPKLNAQQMAKTQGFLECWIARPGHKWIASDFSSVEPHVLAEFSQDPALLSLYGPNAVQNDIYLFTAWHIKGLGDELRNHYDAYNPTAESLALAKRRFKRERQISKTVTLGCGYGAGPNKIKETLMLGGVQLDIDAVYQIHKAYWELYEGVKEFEQRLKREWYRNGGWILNGMGWPIAVAEDKLKDIVNRFNQTTGHLLLQRRILHIDRMRRNIKMWPVLPDDHDNTIWEATESAVPEAVRVFDRSLEQLNEQLGWSVKIKGGTDVVDNFAQLKVEE